MAAAVVSGREQVRANGRAGLIAWIAAATFTAFALLSFPIPLNTELDASWQATLLEAHRRGWQFGTELNFTAGPWGWLASMFALPADFGLRVACDVGLKFLLVGCIAATAWPLRAVRRWLVLAGVLLFGGFFPDTLAFLAIGGLVVAVLFRPERPRWQLAGALIVLTLLAQVKFTFALLAAAGVGLAVISLTSQGQRGRLAVLGGGFVAGFLGWWVAAGQALENLPAYLQASWDIANGYPQAMSVDEPIPVLLAGVGGLVVFLVWAAVTAWRTRRRQLVWPALAFSALLWLVAWRHGFTRGDGHVYGFFLFTLIAGFALPGWLDADARWSWLDLSWLPALAGAALFDAGLIGNTWPILTGRTAANVRAVAHYAGARQQHRVATEAAARRAADEFGDLRSAVGTASIDLLGHEQGALLLLGLNYTPRPMFQSYSAYTPALLDGNGAFFGSPRAPEFALVRFGSIDGRYPAQDDAVALLALARRYDVVSAGDRQVLLRQRRATNAAFSAPREFARGATHAWGRTLELPPADGAVWWLRVELGPTFEGRVHDFFYKPAQVAMIVTDEHGREFRHRLVPAAARRGFPIQPLLETQADANAFFAGEARTWVRAVRFEPMNPKEAEFLGDLTVSWEKRPDFPLRKTHPYRGFVEAGVFDAEPIEITGFAAPSLAEAPAGRAVLVHAPGEITFAVPAGTTHLTAAAGLLPGAFTNGGGTDGAEFSVEAESTDGGRKQLWQSRLDPVAVPADRGERNLDIELPVGTRLVRLRTGNGPAGNASWDWTYWRAVRFTRGT